jgi:outer membrane protein assembly factor BamD (BamD/ComL family)
MTEEPKRLLKVFLCHASGDKPAVRDLYRRLVGEGIDAWLDQEKLMPGQDWQLEIPRAVRESDVVVVCLSKKSVTKEGYIQKEIRFALDSAKEKPEGTIFLIPVRLEDCTVPERLSRWQWVDLFEENGFLRLLRSLKLRADRVGAVIEPPSYDREDSEVEKRLEQLYTDGLAAFYTEDWDRACRRFQAILRERPSHKNAAERLVQAERQRDLAKLYAQSTEAYQSENWLVAIKALEKLLAKSGEYKDAAQLLRNAKKQKQLKELYTEAKTLHAAEKWQAVVRVFEQISVIELAYPDVEGLLNSAQEEVAKLKWIEELNRLYSQGVREMDAGNWHEARSLLEQVHKAQTGFLETERLLRKVEHEITKIEELKQRNVQVNTLYEQAHELARSKNWREALDKIEKIQKLDPQFEDKDGIAERVRAALELKEQEVQKQNQLAALYAEAVRLLGEGKYQDVLDKWQELRAIDPKYPDRQSVQRIAQKRLAARGQRIGNLKWARIITLLIATLIGIAWFYFQISPFTTPECPKTESVNVPFDGGPASTRTRYSYSGRVFITVSGTGQASGTDYTDAFYVFADSEGNKLSPEMIGFSLTINGQLAKNLIPQGQVPTYRDDHVYTFDINAPGGGLYFGVDDQSDDNTGSYRVNLCKK